jgi:hypothetical protein
MELPCSKFFFCRFKNQRVWILAYTNAQAYPERDISKKTDKDDGNTGQEKHRRKQYPFSRGQHPFIQRFKIFLETAACFCASFPVLTFHPWV